MLIEVLKSKIHRAKVTGADLNYSGSITINEAWMHKADLVEFEKVQVLNINNGERFETYVIKGGKDSSEIILNGAAARKVQVGDLIIILSYTWIDKNEYRIFKVEFYDRKKSHLKTMTISGYNKYADKHWRADELNMVNLQNGKSTHKILWLSDE